jgi:hypothetical protein
VSVTPTRILRTAPVTLTRVFTVDEAATDAAGAVTVAATRGDGTTVAGSPFTAAHASLGTYTFTLPGQAVLDRITLVWSATVAGAAVALTDYAEIVGGFLFTLADVRHNYGSLANTAKYPTAALAEARTKVEMEAERICRQAFVPRYGRAVCSGNGADRIYVPHDLVRAVRSASIGGVALTGTDLSGLVGTDTGSIVRPAGIWPAGVHNIVIEYEHGRDAPPPDLADVAMSRMRTFVTRGTSGLPARTQSFTTSDGATYRLSVADRFHTGDVDVDAGYARYARAPRAVLA